MSWFVKFLRTWPVLLLGLATFGLFLVVETYGPLPQPLTVMLRVVIIPLWLMRTLQMIVGIGDLPGYLQIPIAVPLLFLPYVLVDVIIQRLREIRRLRRTYAA